MQILISKWGNSLGVRIPSTWAKELGLEEGSQVDIQKVDGNLVLTRVETPESVALNDLLARVTPENLHGEIDWGKAEGNEIW